MTAISTVGAIIAAAFFARIGWALGGLLMRIFGVGEPHTTITNNYAQGIRCETQTYDSLWSTK